MSRVQRWTPIGVLVVASALSLATGAPASLEPGAILGALLGAAALAGIVHATRSLVPRAPLAWLAGVVLFALALRDASGVAWPTLLSACGVVWAAAAALAHARAPSPRTAALALVMLAVVAASAAWLGVSLGVVVLAWLARTGASRRRLAIGGAALVAVVAISWLAWGSDLPRVTASATALVAALEPGPAAVLLGAGLLGVAFGAATGLPQAGYLAVATLVAMTHAIVVAPAPTVLLALLAIGVAIIPGAVRRLLPELPAVPVVLAATLPLVGVALITARP